MSQSSQEPVRPLTLTQVEAWIDTATRKRLQLHLHATAPLNSLERAQAFWDMGQLCQEAIEEVRVLSAQLRQERQTAHGRAADMRAASAPLLARDPTTTESQLLHIFKGEQRPGGSYDGRE
jgi:hypothetical protein